MVTWGICSIYGGNCDSERLVEIFKESSFVRNALEYLNVRTPWSHPAETEIVHDDLPSRKHLDIGMKSVRQSEQQDKESELNNFLILKKNSPQSRRERREEKI